MSDTSTASPRPVAHALARHRHELKRLAERYGLSELAVFGSVARGDDTAGSDVDLLVTGTEGTTYFDLVEFESAASTLLGAPVDAVFRDGLRAGIDDDIRRDARRL